MAVGLHFLINNYGERGIDSNGDNTIRSRWCAVFFSLRFSCMFGISFNSFDFWFWFSRLADGGCWSTKKRNPILSRGVERDCGVERWKSTGNCNINAEMLKARNKCCMWCWLSCCSLVTSLLTGNGVGCLYLETKTGPTGMQHLHWHYTNLCVMLSVHWSVAETNSKSSAKVSEAWTVSLHTWKSTTDKTWTPILSFYRGHMLHSTRCIVKLSGTSCGSVETLQRLWTRWRPLLWN